MTGRALSKITSSFMVITSDHTKTNLGLSLKFEVKALKVIDYSRKDGRTWEYSQKAVDLIKEYKVWNCNYLFVDPFSYKSQQTFPEVFRILDKSGDGQFPAVKSQKQSI